MHKLTKRNEQTGFTIIEVVLVLAIAGLIFLIVFLALPQLQQSRRDTQRKSDLGLLMSSLETYASNNNGLYPLSLGHWRFLAVFDNTLADPSTGVPYAETFTEQEEINPGWTLVDPSVIPGVGVAFAGNEGGSTPTPPGTIAYSRGAQCNGDTSQATMGNAKVAVMIKLEAGQYCLDNS